MITMFETTMSRLDRLEGMLEASERRYEASKRRAMQLALDRQRNAYKSDNADDDNSISVFNPYVELDDGQIVESSLKQVLIVGMGDRCRFTVVFAKGTLSTVWWNPSGGERPVGPVGSVARLVGALLRLTAVSPPTAPQTPGPTRTVMRVTPHTMRPTFARW